jgi:transposase
MIARVAEAPDCHTAVPALPSWLTEPIWDQFAALLPERHDTHPLGCHRPRIPDRVVFDKLLQVLVFGCAYERIADHLPAPQSERVGDPFGLAAVSSPQPGRRLLVLLPWVAPARWPR